MKITLFATSILVASSQFCVEVPEDKCGTTALDDCLACGPYGCEQCCPGCFLRFKGKDSYCECVGGDDSWETYEVDGMQVTSVTGGPDPDDYEKAVVLLHGGGGSGTDWIYQYNQGWFGNMTGIKYIFPTSALNGNVWYVSYKNGCGLEEECAYDLDSIEDSASRVATLIEQERQVLGGDGKKVYVSGFSQGAQLSAYMQIAKLDFALGGTVVMSGFPLPPLSEMNGADPAEAKKNATYYGEDMKWMIWIGANDYIFPAEFTMNYYNGMFKALEAESTLDISVINPGQSHTVIKEEFDLFIKLVREN